MARKRNPYEEQARAQSIVRFGPELSALTALLRDAEEERDLAIRQAKSGRQYNVGAVEAAMPRVATAYQGAQQAVQPAFAQGGGVEAQALTARLGEAAALARTQLEGRRVSAIEGEGAARAAAHRGFATDRSKIGQRLLDLTREQGAFTSATIGDLQAADAKAIADAAETQARLDQSERNSIRSSGIDPNTGLPIPGGRLDPKAKPGKPNQGRGWATQNEQGQASDTVQNAISWAAKLKKAGWSRAEAAQDLMSGIEDAETPLYNPDRPSERQVWRAGEPGNKDGKLTGQPKVKTVKGVPKIDEQLYLSVALDMAYDGHLSRRNQKLLHERGIKIGPLGVLTYNEWRRRLKRAVAGVGRSPSRPGSAPSGPGSRESRPT